MVTRTEFQSAIEAASIPLMAIMSPLGEDIPPNIEITRVAEDDENFFAKAKRRFISPSRFEEFPRSARSAVTAAYDSLERRFATAIAETAVIETDSLRDCIDTAHGLFDLRGFPSNNRFLALSPREWDRQMQDPQFASWPSVMMRESRMIDRMIWFRLRYLEPKAVCFCSSAIAGGIDPYDPKPGRVASAGVAAHVVLPDGVRVLKWPLVAKDAA